MKEYTLLDGVTFTTETTGIVISSDGTKQYHFVISQDGNHICECPQNAILHKECKHIKAAKIKHAEKKLLEAETK
jgi:hypothetical protein